MHVSLAIHQSLTANPAHKTEPALSVLTPSSLSLLLARAAGLAASIALPPSSVMNAAKAMSIYQENALVVV